MKKNITIIANASDDLTNTVKSFCEAFLTDPSTFGIDPEDIAYAKRMSPNPDFYLSFVLPSNNIRKYMKEHGYPDLGYTGDRGNIIMICDSTCRELFLTLKINKSYTKAVIDRK